MAYDVVSVMRADCFRGKRGLRRYIYEWMLTAVSGSTPLSLAST